MYDMTWLTFLLITNKLLGGKVFNWNALFDCNMYIKTSMITLNLTIVKFKTFKGESDFQKL